MSKTKNQLEIGRSRNGPRNNDPFEHVPLELGKTMYIDTRVGTKEMKPLVSIVLGHMKGQYIILSTPQVDGVPVKYNTANPITIYFLQDRTVYFFKTKVMRFLGPPFYMTIFQNPDQIEATSLRSSTRFQVGIPFERAAGNSEKEFIINLSSTGALLKISSKMPINSQFDVSFYLPNGVSVNNIGCTVKRVDLTESRMLAGVEFDEQHEDFFAVERYMNFVLGAIETESDEIEEAASRKDVTDLLRKFG